MKKNYVFYLFMATVFLMFLATPKTYAIDYSISFTGSGASTAVGDVIVQNLTKGTTVTVPVGNVLNLYDVVSAVDLLTGNIEGISICSNPVQGESTVSFIANKGGNTQIDVYAIDGRKIVGLNKSVEAGKNSFLLSLPQGVYVINIAGNEYKYTAKIIGQANAEKKLQITFIDNVKKEMSAPQRIKSAVTPMLYTIGDHLLYKGISGNYSTIVTDIPTGSKTMDFEFSLCQDGDGNNYSAVKIGTQVWMAENLRTSKYRAGEIIDNVTVAVNIPEQSGWAYLKTGAWCDYDNNAENDAKYGKLYNWYAVNDLRQIAPAGWHVATDAEWTTLQDFLSTNGYNSDGSLSGNKVAKSLAANSDWTNCDHCGGPGTDWTKNNLSGFTALPGGNRDYAGTFNGIGLYNYGMWWTATEVNTFWSWIRILSYGTTYIDIYNPNKECGNSVRCVKD